MSLESQRNEGTYLAFSVVIMDTWTHDPKIKLKKKKTANDDDISFPIKGLN